MPSISFNLSTEQIAALASAPAEFRVGPLASKLAHLDVDRIAKTGSLYVEDLKAIDDWIAQHGGSRQSLALGALFPINAKPKAEAKARAAEAAKQE